MGLAFRAPGDLMAGLPLYAHIHVVVTLRRLIVVQRAANNEYTGGPGGPGIGFCGPGGG